MLSPEDPARRAYIHVHNHNHVSSRHHSSSDLSRTKGPPPVMQHIWIVTGPAGCGKTTVAKGLSKELSLPYIEGDDYHSKSNKEKMSNNIPLTDADRWDWLIQLREASIKCLNSSSAPTGVVVTCSALKHKYRDVIRVAAYDHPSVKIHFVYLRASEAVLLQRVMKRNGHYMKSDMVQSQLQTLEEPDDEWDVLAVDCAASPAEVQARVSNVVRKKLADYQ
ncbi:hypothetical protein AJ80_05271 [Polytolypa hystricis UAMH7299]|uniref:Gluconokinase n=1 Tax=Polytolypa hystricis (strain UAMH7299) TaxID=1447883 RepID=A0A2B7Y5S2_POLH7|nr:hypothetical protein AJ80_05271 [Polytolypa hystricis UAMH7299]